MPLRRRPERAQIVLQRRGGTPQAALQSTDLSHAPRDDRRATPTVYMSVEDVQRYVPTLKSRWAVYRWASSSGVFKGRVGRRLVFTRGDIDAAIQRTRRG